MGDNKKAVIRVDCRSVEEACAKLEGQYKFSKPTLIMAALGSISLAWNTGPETKSILTAMSPGGLEVGDYCPLSRSQRHQIFVWPELGESSHKLLMDGVTWVVPTEIKHTNQRLVTLYRRADKPSMCSIGVRSKRSPELGKLTDQAAQASLALKEVDRPWGRELHNGLRDRMLRGVSPMGHEAAKVVARTRDAWKAEFVMTDPAIEVSLGAINVIYSYAVEPGDVRRFCEVHRRRCLRMVGPHTTIDAVPLYRWHATGSETTVGRQVARLVADQEVGVTRDLSGVSVWRTGWAM